MSRSHLQEQFYELGRVPDCPVYDMHAHMGPFNGIYMPRNDPASMVHSAEHAGVKLVVFSHHAALLCPDIGNAASIEAVRRFPERLRAYCLINPNYPEIIRRDLETYDQYQDVYIGLKYLADYHQYAISDERYQPAWGMANERGLPVLMHTWGGSRFDGAGEVRKVAERYPNAKILMGHSCHDDWDGAIGVVKDFPNVYFELCAVMDERGILERFVEACGSERILFGTDLPWFNEHYYIGAVLGAGITDDDRRNIFYRNAEKLLGVS